MKRLRSVSIFLLQCTVIGLAVACVILLLRPELLAPGRSASQPATYAQAVARSADSVVNVYTTRFVREPGSTGTVPRLSSQSSLGSGVIIDSDGYIVTNYHVIAGANQRRVQLADGRIADAEVVGTDPDTDLALLRIELADLKPITFGRSDRLRIGDVVLAIGNPYGLSQTVTQGIVSATGRGQLNLTTFENYIQTDAAINSGNSGGALINADGALVGINTAVISREVNIQGISFAIPVNLVSGVVRELREHGHVPRGWLGLEPADLTAGEHDRLGLAQDEGILMRAVLRDGPAWQAGIRPGDVLLAIDGNVISTSQQALLQVASYSPGASIELTFLRDNRRETVTAIAGDRASAPVG